MSLFSALNVGTRGLQAAQIGMNVTSQNISNADVPGYSRKRLNQSADYRYDGSFGQMGFGVTVVSIERVRNVHIDNQIRHQNFQKGRFEAMDKSLYTVENILMEPSETGLQSSMDRFFDSWNNLANNPADAAARTMVRTNAENLTGTFNNISSELQREKNNKNFEIASAVTEINKISKEIYALNSEIVGTELSNQNANDSRDRRDMLLERLSELIEFDVTENPNGSITVTTAGNILVSNVGSNELEIYEDVTTRTADGEYHQYGIRMANSKRQIQPRGGQLQGLIESRDILIPAYEKAIDDMAKTLVEEVNEQHRQGFNLNGYTGFNFFEISGTTAGTIKIAPSILSDTNNIAAAGGGDRLIGQSHLIEASEAFTTTSEPRPITNQTLLMGSISVLAQPGGHTLVENEDFRINYTNGTIELLNSDYDNRGLQVEFNVISGNYPGPGNNENALRLASIRNKLLMNPNHSGDGTTTISDFYAGAIGQLGLQRGEIKSNLDTRVHLIEEYKNQRDSISGVSLDEEMAELIRFQQTYSAAARIITTTQKMLDILNQL